METASDKADDFIDKGRLTGWPKRTANTVIDLLGFSKETS